MIPYHTQKEDATIGRFIFDIQKLLNKLDYNNCPEFKFEHLLPDGGKIIIKRKEQKL